MAGALDSSALLSLPSTGRLVSSGLGWGGEGPRRAGAVAARGLWRSSNPADTA
jgi:hypothetical protein